MTPRTHSIRLWCALIAALGLLPSGWYPVAHAQTNTPIMMRFGVVNAYEDPKAAAELGVTWEQITFDWAAFQPTGPDHFVTRSVDASWLELAEDAGREVVGLIVGVPRWASESGAWSAVPGGLDRPIDDPRNRWAAFVTRLVATYAPLGVHQWIISEEPNIRPGEGRVRFSGEVEDYASLLRVASLAARAVDPGARIIVAGMSGWADSAAGREPYLARLLAVLLADPDASSFDYYFDAAVVRAFDSTQAVWDSLTDARAALNEAGLDAKPIWLITNAGPTLDPAVAPASGLFGITANQQADFVIQAVTIALALGVERLAIDRLLDAPTMTADPSLIGAVREWITGMPGADVTAWGLVRADNSRRPAFEAYRRAIRWGERTHAVEWFSHPKADLVILEQAERDVFLMWARGAEPVSIVITSGFVGETGMLSDSVHPSSLVLSDATEYPAAFVVSVPGALPDANGFLSVAGSPRRLALDRTDFYRVIYLDTANGRIRLK